MSQADGYILLVRQYGFLPGEMLEAFGYLCYNIL